VLLSLFGLKESFVLEILLTQLLFLPAQIHAPVFIQLPEIAALQFFIKRVASQVLIPTLRYFLNAAVTVFLAIISPSNHQPCQKTGFFP
jgi:hypothetical protein